MNIHYVNKRKTNTYIKENDNMYLCIDSKKFGEIKVLIDEDDFIKCKSINWYSNFGITSSNYYIYGVLNKKNISIHRYLTNCPDGMQVDHINHNSLDNRKQNLKVCTQMENLQNLRKYKTNSSGQTGVVFHKTPKKWASFIQRNHNVIALGLYHSKNCAIFMRHYAKNQFDKLKEIDMDKITFMKRFMKQMDKLDIINIY